MRKLMLSFSFLALALTGACTQVAGQTTAATEPAKKVVEEKDLTTYLFVYFKDDTHSLYFALSRDGYSFTDVNNAKPIMLGSDLAEQKGIRDPHIARGPDGAFYLAMTDLHVNGMRAGYRTTQWERPVELYDWGNNRAIVMMKSTDLVNWSHADFRIDKAFEETKEVGCIWAPETIYDPEKKKMMVYFTMRIAHGPTKLYYSYADDAFTKLETVPVELFKYPTNNQILDADITKVGDEYHMFYVAQGNGGGIKQAVSKSINKDYVFDPKSYDPETVGREAPNVWRRLGTDQYVLMVDVFGLRPTNFGFSETTDFKTFKNLGHFNEAQSPMKATNFSMQKHGAVIPITTEEAKVLAAHWKFDFELLKSPTPK
jgi:hypothetical protein